MRIDDAKDEASPRSLRDAFRGALLGTLVGDALGAPVEGWSAQKIRAIHGEVREMLDGGRGRGRYTDDTEMMLLLGDALLEGEEILPESFARRLAEEAELERGYGSGTKDVIRKLREGRPWAGAARGAFPRGSFGNGAAIRVVPVALLHHHDPEGLVRVAEESAVATHPHPLGIAGAVLQAQQIALALSTRGEPLDPIRFVVELRSTTTSGEFRQKLRAVESCLDHPLGDRMTRDRLGFNSTALGSVTAALYAVLRSPESFEDAVTYAIRIGGDTDSVAAMAGAISGAYHGAEAIPRRWLDPLEEDGVKRAERLARAVLEKHVTIRVGT